MVDQIEKKVEGLINTINKDNAWFIFNSIIKYINRNILIVPCDIIFESDLQQSYSEVNDKNCYIVPVEYKDGMNIDVIESDENRNIRSISRKQGIIGNGCASGIQICNPSFVNKIINKEENWYNVWAALIAKKRLKTTSFFVENWKTYDTLDQLIKNA